MTADKKPKEKQLPGEKVPQRFVENVWQGLPHYECLDCAFDTLDRSRMLAHIKSAHGGE